MRNSAFRMPRLFVLLAILFGSAALLASDEPQLWKRVSQTPVISPQGATWESAGTFNPAVIRHDNKVVMLYRAQDADGVSRLGYAESTDGIHFKRRPDPVFAPEASYELGGGVEDPRLVRIDKLYYMTYTGYNKSDAQLCLATSHDLIHWDRKGVLVPAYKGKWNTAWTKSGGILTEKIDGKYWMYWLGTSREHRDEMGLSFSYDLVHWTEATATPVLPGRPGKFDFRVVEPGPPPVLTPEGIVLIYNGADENLVYRTGIAVFDRKDPRRLLYRSDQPVFEPQLDWEKIGQVPNVVFVEGMLKEPNRFLLYYGGADKYVGIVEAPSLLTH
jgi:beta-1,2-mannosidase